MKQILVSAILFGLTIEAHAKDAWSYIERGVFCAIETGSLDDGQISTTFKKGYNLTLNLEKNNHSFPAQRMCGLENCPRITKIKVKFSHADGHHNWLEGFAQATVDPTTGRGSLEMPILQKNAVMIIEGLDDANEISFEFADGSPSWSFSAPGVEITDKFADCITRLGGIRKTRMD